MPARWICKYRLQNGVRITGTQFKLPDAGSPVTETPSSRTFSAGAGDLCMTGLSAMTSAMGKGAGRVFILISGHCSCGFILKVWLQGEAGRVFPPGQEIAFPRH